jgi:hypothetical protein
VSPLYGSRPNAEVSGIGWSTFLGTLVLLVPLLPLVVIVRLVGTLVDVAAGRRGASQGSVRGGSAAAVRASRTGSCHRVVCVAAAVRRDTGSD